MSLILEGLGDGDDGEMVLEGYTSTAEQPQPQPTPAPQQPTYSGGGFWGRWAPPPPIELVPELPCLEPECEEPLYFDEQQPERCMAPELRQQRCQQRQLQAKADVADEVEQYAKAAGEMLRDGASRKMLIALFKDLVKKGKD